MQLGVNDVFHLCYSKLERPRSFICFLVSSVGIDQVAGGNQDTAPTGSSKETARKTPSRFLRRLLSNGGVWSGKRWGINGEGNVHQRLPSEWRSSCVAFPCGHERRRVGTAWGSNNGKVHLWPWQTGSILLPVDLNSGKNMNLPEIGIRASLISVMKNVRMVVSRTGGNRNEQIGTRRMHNKPSLNSILLIKK